MSGQSMNHACPDDALLRSFALGQLPGAASVEIELHVDTCHECQSRINTLDDADSFVELLRQAPADDRISIEPELVQMLAAIERLAGDDAGVREAAGAGRRTHDDPTPESDLGRIGPYLLLREMGRGGMGIVYEAVHELSDKRVALKVLSPAIAADQRALARFYQEIKALGKLHHPTIVELHHAGEVDGRHFLAMEFVPGRDLSAVLDEMANRGIRLRVADACELARHVAIGLDHAHSHGRVHRDIKPSNLILTRTPTGQCLVKILDFGLASLQDDRPDSAKLTRFCTAMGTADYMSPEQTQDAARVDIRADLYALGCTLYTLLAGKPPFHLRIGHVAKAIAHQQEPIRPIRDIRPDVPVKLAELIGRLLAKRPHDRPATPAEVARALKPHCQGSHLGRLLADPAGGEAASAMSDPSVGTHGDHAEHATDRSDRSSAPPMILARAAVAPMPAGEASDQRAAEASLPVAIPVALPIAAADAAAGSAAASESALDFGIEPVSHSARPSFVVPPRRRFLVSRTHRQWMVAAVAAAMLLIVGGIAAYKNGDKPVKVPIVIVKPKNGGPRRPEPPTKRKIQPAPDGHEAKTADPPATDGNGASPDPADVPPDPIPSPVSIPAPPPVPVPEPVIDFDPVANAEAARIVLEMKGRVQVEESGMLRVYESMADLPPEGISFRIVGIMQGEPPDEMLERLPPLPNLRYIVIKENSTERGMDQLVKFPGLTAITHDGARLSDDGLRVLKHLPKLECLESKYWPPSDKGIMHLKDLTRLATLQLDGARDPNLISNSNRGLILLTQTERPFLDRLTLMHYGINDQALPMIARLKALKFLRLESCDRIDGSGFATVVFPELECLELLGNNSLTDQAVGYLPLACPKLTRVAFRSCDKLTDKCLETLADVKGLKEVSLTNTRLITRQGVERLAAELPRCRIISDFGTIEPRQ